MPRTLVALLAAAFLTSGCAYVGSPLPPLANVPVRITDLNAVQRAARIIIHFTLPTLTTEGFPIRSALKPDLRIGPAGQSPDSFTPIPEGPVVNGLATYEVPSGPWTGTNITIAVRAVTENGKDSGWSEFANLQVVAPARKPEGLKVENAAEGVRLRWEGPPGQFRVFRRSGDEPGVTRMADVEQTSWTDTNVELGKRYSYLVQRVIKVGEGREAESDPTAEAAISPADTFPPAAPSGLRANAAPSSIELSWDRNPEPDLAGYRIYRAVGNGVFEKIAEISQIPTYSDQAVTRGTAYRYAITATDTAGNESARSPVAEAAVP